MKRLVPWVLVICVVVVGVIVVAAEPQPAKKRHCPTCDGTQWEWSDTQRTSPSVSTTEAVVILQGSVQVLHKEVQSLRLRVIELERRSKSKVVPRRTGAVYRWSPGWMAPIETKPADAAKPEGE